MAASAPAWLLGVILVAQIVAVTTAGLHIADEATTIIRALTSVEGPADPPDETDLAAAEDHLQSATDDGGFRVELHEDEITAVLQDGLQEADVPLRRVTVDIVDGTGPDNGRLDFVGVFKAEDVTVRGSVLATIEAGAVQVDVVDVELGDLNVPGIAAGAIEDAVDDLLGRVSDVNELLAAADADVQSISIGDDRLVITGTQGSEAVLTSASLLAGLQEQAAAASAAVQPPPERLGPGEVNARFAEGSVYYLALGDSLAANVGVTSARDGYVSRLHRQLQLRDGRDYGLSNLGISGETSGTMIRAGQLDEAVAFLRDNRVAYVTIDIGANDLLGHLGSDDCAESTATVACRQRIASTFASYEDNIEVIFSALRAAAPDATIVFVRAYNPFSLGIAPDVGFERESSETLDALNDAAADLARDFDIVVADAFTPMQNTAAATTHMFDTPPDIHPTEIGYDVIAAAILDALG
jgi:lysophospholipase L1-like esterase